MTNTNINFIELAELFISKKMDNAQLQALAQQRKDLAFEKEFLEALNFISLVEDKSAQKQFKDTLQSIAAEGKPKITKSISLKSHYLRTAAVAAGVALITTTATHWLGNNKTVDATKYSELKKVRTEIEGIKQSQNRIIRDLDAKANKPAIENKYSGTGFALSNNGYLLTNYHVTDGADSIYIETKDGQYHKASLVSFDLKADVALLKVESKKFKFSKQDQLPYNFASGKSALGEKVFTLGYPETDVVYNEGYVSSRNGFLGDSMQYRLELPAEPGQSGSPVLNANGAIVGMVSGKATNSEGITYAVSSVAMLKMLRNIPQANLISLPKISKMGKLGRTQQIEKLQEYTCVVHIYKK